MTTDHFGKFIVKAERISVGRSPHAPDWQSYDQALTTDWRQIGAAGAGDGSTDFRILATLAPVLEDVGNEVAYAGDPMCLYWALTTMIERVWASKECPTGGSRFYPFMAPSVGRKATFADRVAVAGGPDRENAYDILIPNDLVFDPRYWNEDVKQSFVRLLLHSRPRVVLISAVSPAHPKALKMAAVIRENLPRCLIILGGRHADETIQWPTEHEFPTFAYSSTIAAIADGRIAQLVDFVVAGEGYYALDLLMRAISLVLSVDAERLSVGSVMQAVSWLMQSAPEFDGFAIISGLERRNLAILGVEGPPVHRENIPLPYEVFAMKARFHGVSRNDDGSRPLTAHAMTVSTCPFRCGFCSEGREVLAELRSPSRVSTESAVHQLVRYRELGAEFIFFDDPVFLNGSLAAIRRMCEELNALSAGPWTSVAWGAQLTVDLILKADRAGDAPGLASLMREAGCAYVYIGLESMAEDVIRHVDKNKGRAADRPWKDRVRLACSYLKAAEITIGVSVLFGLDGEDAITIRETVDDVAELIEDRLVDFASPNILTYHPGASITREHGFSDSLDLHTDSGRVAPFSYFEEAHPGTVTKNLGISDIWYIHRFARDRWRGARNVAGTEPWLVGDENGWAS